MKENSRGFLGPSGLIAIASHRSIAFHISR
jgi:hypothetical protein